MKHGKKGKIFANLKDAFTTEKGGINPSEAKIHHIQVADKIISDALAKATRLIAAHKTDPIGTMGALTAYVPVSRDFVSALKGIAAVIITEGEPSVGSPGAYIVEIARSTEGL